MIRGLDRWGAARYCSGMNDPAVTGLAAGEASLLGGLLHAAHQLEDELEERLAGVSLSRAKLKVLTTLVRAGEPIALRELADRIQCVRSNVTQLVDRLEAEGLVRRVDDPDDRRSVRAEITREGRERQARGESLVASQEAEFAARFSTSQRRLLTELFGILP